jgi:hypothetical protein
MDVAIESRPLPALDYLSLHFEPLLQSGNRDFKFARLDDGFVIGPDEGEIVGPQTERQRAALARFQIDLGKAFDPFSCRR